jgi:DNA-binding NtrC family response regulator
VKRVLVINEDTDFRGYIGTLLRDAGYAVVLPPRNPLEKAALEAQAVDAIVTDLFMSNVEAIELVETARQRAPSVPIIGMSGGPSWARGRCMVAIKILSAKTALVTPLDVAALLSLLRDVLEQNAASPTSPAASK